ncbi:MAG TPA: radical SAM protein [Candidatus Omnitrophota bacterium]|nr:radical SAM protein [Candidatus Omnitrophota bacterium]
MERILLINPSGWQKESINLGLSYLASSLMAHGFDVLILDLNRYEMSDAAFLENVRQFSPRLVGISIKTATAREGGRLSRLLKEAMPEVITVAGGPHMSLCPESYMRDYPSISFGVMGEGEEAMVHLAKAICNGGKVEKLNGIVWRQNGQILLNKWMPPENLDALMFPNLDVIQGFSWKNFRYPILSSRGCPFGCIYCCVNKLTGSRKWRYRTPENVVDELESLVRTKGITSFEIWDDNFTLDLSRAKKICQLLIDRKLNLSWYCHNGIRADRIDEELAQMMKAAGCTSLAFGVESGSPVTFAAIKKGEPLSAVINAVKLVKKAGIKAVGYFIIGLPGDTLERFVETVYFQRSLELDHYVYGMLIPYPHTELWEIVQTHGTMFCEITETQHFSDDMVPISFELPDFPKADMIRAFYIAKYFDLFDAIRQVADSVNLTVVHHVSPPMISHLPGMFIAGGSKICHVVVGGDEAVVRALPSFTQVPNTTKILFSDNMPSDIPFENQIAVVDQGSNILERISPDSGLVLFDARRPLRHLTLVRLPKAGSLGARGAPDSDLKNDEKKNVFSKALDALGIHP